MMEANSQMNEPATEKLNRLINENKECSAKLNMEKLFTE